MDQPFYDISVSDSDVAKELKEIKGANYIAFDSDFFDIIGNEPSWEEMYTLPVGLKEAPVFIPHMNVLYFSDQAAGKLYKIDLSKEPPPIEHVELHPPLEGVSGMGYSSEDGLIYVTVNACPSAPAGIYSIDPETLKTKTVVNNFIGHHFNSPNDLALSPGAVWFTDLPYAALLGNASAAELRPIVYHFNLKTKVLTPVDEDIQMPNGIATSVEHKTLSVADSGALYQPIGLPTVPDRHHSVYTYDIVGSGRVCNKRLFYISDLWVPDGLTVSRNVNCIPLREGSWML